MDEPVPLAHRVRPIRAAHGSGDGVLQRQLEATRAALEAERRRRATTQAECAEELRRHEQTRSALAAETRRREATQELLDAAEARRRAVEAAADDVLRAARGVLRARKPQRPGSRGEPVAGRLASVLEEISTPVAAGRGDTAQAGPNELTRRFERIRSRLADDVPAQDDAR